MCLARTPAALRPTDHVRREVPSHDIAARLNVEPFLSDRGRDDQVEFADAEIRKRLGGGLAQQAPRDVEERVSPKASRFTQETADAEHIPGTRVPRKDFSQRKHRVAARDEDKATVLHLLAFEDRLLAQ